MERFTQRAENGNVFYPHCFKECQGMAETEKCINCDYYDKLLKRFADYEDIGRTPEQLKQIDEWYGEMCRELGEYKRLEEQGLILRLPCKVGTSVYIVNRYWIDEGHICGIAEADDIDCFCFKVYRDPDDYTMVAVEEFNKTWFFTKEEAEQALNQMGE
jgi:hypothetical protein